ncbi:MAG: tRNA pseudouridine(13) synthase TruD [Planctomycetes bacterium]|nr:tRNA pseudouridine(13) synthase TruD [Planctomycetota bacterium]
MKLRQVPSDFIVTEHSSFTPQATGRYFVYRLDKRSLSTLEALSIIAKRAGLRPKQLSASGLKDKHAEASQLFSADRPLPGEIKDDRFTVTFVGKSDRPLTAAFIDANSFKLVLRGLTPEECAVIAQNTAEIRDCGVPNYYDNQRFGSNVHGQGFISKALVQGRFEEAMRLHMAVPHRKQSLRDKNNRRAAQELWGKWQELRKRMTKSPEQALVAFLCTTTYRAGAEPLVADEAMFAACFERITPSLRIMYVAAYQSLIFNETLRRFLEAERDQQRVDLVQLQNRGGFIPMHRFLAPAQLREWRDLEFPLVAASTKLDEFPRAREHVEAVLAAEGITLEQLRLKPLPRTRFKAAKRKILMFAKDLKVSDVLEDDLNPGRYKVETSFTLPRGSFATIVARRLALGAGTKDEQDDS